MKNNMNGVQLIAAERTRQMEDEKFAAEHDDVFHGFQLTLAAVSYAFHVAMPDEEGDEKGRARPCHDWPWGRKWWKPSEDPVRNLVKAGALIAAEIDRLQRCQAQSERGRQKNGVRKI